MANIRRTNFFYIPCKKFIWSYIDLHFLPSCPTFKRLGLNTYWGIKIVLWGVKLGLRYKLCVSESKLWGIPIFTYLSMQIKSVNIKISLKWGSTFFPQPASWDRKWPKQEAKPLQIQLLLTLILTAQESYYNSNSNPANHTKSNLMLTYLCKFSINECHTVLLEFKL